MPSGATNAFVIYRATDGQYYFVIKGGNSEVLMTSETYTRKESAENGRSEIFRGPGRDSAWLVDFFPDT
jgi:uncharacterized protein YegP (UPF0339 family)